MKNVNVTLAANLKKFRRINNLSQSELAGMLGLTRTAYANYEDGRREVPFDVLEKIATVYGCELYMFYEEDIREDELYLACAFRTDEYQESDLEEVCNFKKIVRAYLKMERIENGEAVQA